ncbi:hypothetical protein ACFSNC_25450 [Ancylobacter oerskovii]|uniref:GlxA family transcriptional regulator n=1 Tax=Ancylobacter oerskovii TaxID=459519 RepID=A0ABW4Z5I3_9HYPH
MKIGLVVCPDFQLIGLAAIATLEVANKRAGETLYELDVLSEEGGLIMSSSGMQALTKRSRTSTTP